MVIQIFGLANDSIVDGEGLRFTVFTQGCPHRCEGCHNPQSHDPLGGVQMDTEAILEKIDANPLLDGITLSGGEPFMQLGPCAVLARAAKTRGLNVWVYSGYTFEELLVLPGAFGLLEQTDVLVDGRFILRERSLELRFRGSKNQRVIDVPRSLTNRAAVLLKTILN